MSDKQVNEVHKNLDAEEVGTQQEVESLIDEQTQEGDSSLQDGDPSDSASGESEAIQALEEKIQDLEDQNLRLQAEIANMQRSSKRDRQEAAKYRSQFLAKELLDVLDNLERALATEIQSEDAQALHQGVNMVHKQFLTAFEAEGITVIDPKGEAFDPQYHQAVQMMPGQEGQASHTILEVLQKGYLLNERILRPAMVIVAE